jgi:hypothetical protein
MTSACFTLINTNRMVPPIGPVRLDYIGATARRAGIEVKLVDLCLAEDPDATIHQQFLQYQPELVGLSFRNVDDCFWPSGQSFLPELQIPSWRAVGRGNQTGLRPQMHLLRRSAGQGQNISIASADRRRARN